MWVLSHNKYQRYQNKQCQLFSYSWIFLEKNKKSAGQKYYLHPEARFNFNLSKPSIKMQMEDDESVNQKQPSQRVSIRHYYLSWDVDLALLSVEVS